MSRIEEQVIEQIRNRAAIGKEKYGVTIEEAELPFLQWL